MNGFLISIDAERARERVAERPAGERADQADQQRLEHEDAAHGALRAARATS